MKVNLLGGGVEGVGGREEEEGGGGMNTAGLLTPPFLNMIAREMVKEPATWTPPMFQCTNLKGTGHEWFISGSLLFSSDRYSGLADESNKAVGLIKTQREKDKIYLPFWSTSRSQISRSSPF
jgi:hypothetical protein